jgi:hypothetical protein
MSEKVKEFVEIPQSFVREGTQVRRKGEGNVGAIQT